MYKQQYTLPISKDFICPECKSNRFRLSATKLQCTNCDYSISTKRSNKFGAQRTEFNGKQFDSRYEADVAATLELRKKTGDIKDYDTQFKVEMWAYNCHGKPALKKSHKVDFRIHHNDGSYELLEAKGVETSDYKDRRKWLETFWLPEHRDHIYTVVKQGGARPWTKKR